MKKHEDPNYIVKVEQAIAKKYGKETIQNPRGNWDEEKEKEYEEQLKKLADKERDTEDRDEKIEVDGILMSRKLLNTDDVIKVLRNIESHLASLVYYQQGSRGFGASIEKALAQPFTGEMNENKNNDLKEIIREEIKKSLGDK